MTNECPSDMTNESCLLLPHFFSQGALGHPELAGTPCGSLPSKMNAVNLRTDLQTTPPLLLKKEESSKELCHVKLGFLLPSPCLGPTISKSVTREVDPCFLKWPQRKSEGKWGHLILQQFPDSLHQTAFICCGRHHWYECCRLSGKQDNSYPNPYGSYIPGVWKADNELLNKYYTVHQTVRNAMEMNRWGLGMRQCLHPFGPLHTEYHRV